MSQARRDRGRAARASGRRAEVVAALWLMAKGYRILGFRLKTPFGEIDLLAGVEVKTRATLEASLAAVGAEQRSRLRRGLRFVAGKRRGLADATIRLDLMALAPGRLPRHIPDAWSEDDPFH